jgi:Uma2 family endonuclease
VTVEETAMTQLDMPPHLPMTAEEFERLPPVEGWRMELWEGNLDVASAAQIRWHAIVAHRIGRFFEASGHEVSYETGVVLKERTVRIPDVTRFHLGARPGLHRSQFPAGEVDCAVEIVSAESQKRDRLIKPEEYAEAGIPEFWLVEEHPDDEADAMINIYKLTPARTYGLAQTAALSALEHTIEG